jgi:predicted transcriptional regulator
LRAAPGDPYEGFIDRQGAAYMPETPEPASVAALTAEIVSAYVSNNQIASSELASFISAVAAQLSKVGTLPEQATDEKPEPAVSVRRSVRPDHLVCLVCGKPQKMLKRHLAVRHGLTPAEYRDRFGLKLDYPMTAPNYAQQRREVGLRLQESVGLVLGRMPGWRARSSSSSTSRAFWV